MMEVGRGWWVREVREGVMGELLHLINFQFESRDGFVKNVNTRVGLGDRIVQRSQAVYETVSGSIDPIVRDNEHTWITEIGMGYLNGKQRT